MVVGVARNQSPTVSRAQHKKGGAQPLPSLPFLPRLASGTHLLLGGQLEFSSHRPKRVEPETFYAIVQRSATVLQGEIFKILGQGIWQPNQVFRRQKNCCKATVIGITEVKGCRLLLIFKKKQLLVYYPCLVAL